MLRCGKCKYFGVCPVSKHTVCYLYPPKVEILNKKKMVRGRPVFISFRPEVDRNDKPCKAFHEVFDPPRSKSEGNRDGNLGM